ncbi:MAG: polyphenol oxidase family protein [Candidatus Paceibacterota bacterium]
MSQLFHETSTIKDGNLGFKWGASKEVLANRIAFLDRFSMSLANCVSMEVEHGDNITHVTKTDIGKTIITEAFITNDKNVLLFLLTADCFPVVFYDPLKEVVGLAHLGWKPIDKQLAKKVIAEMREVYESSVEDIQVFLGPGIHKESYLFENPPHRNLSGWSQFLTISESGETHIDLIGHIEEQLLGKGILPKNIHISPIDTATSNEYFSHYRAIRSGEAEGRFATIAALL